jgi:phenylacetate-coenzyme A ligase PaaK-like adenylate-forming protein
MARTYWDRLPAKQIRLAQEQKLIWFLREKVYPGSPYYRKLFDERGIKPEKIRSMKDFQGLPFTTKADIAPSPEDAEKPVEFVLRFDGIDEGEERRSFQERWSRFVLGKKGYQRKVLDEYYPSHVHFTTGRTALPTPIFYTPYDMDLMRECGRRLGELMELDQEDMLINAFPFAPHLAFWMTYITAEVLHAHAIHTGGGRIMGSDRILEAMEKFRGTILAGTPSYCYHLLRKAASLKKEIPTVKTLIMGADRVPPGLRRKMFELLSQLGSERVDIISTYAFTEGKVAWPECRASVREGESTGYHLFPDREIIEVIDPETGEPVEEGEGGEVVYTSLNWRGSVLLRYRTGDLVKEGITYKPCPYCGRTVPRLGLTISRLSDYKEFQLTKLKGELVDMNAFYPLLSGHPEVLEWQLEIHKHNDDPYDLDELHLYIAPVEGVNEEKLRGELNELVRKELDITPNKIFFLDLESMLERLEMESLAKEKRFLDLRPTQ